MTDPAASIEDRSSQRVRARVRLDAHPAMAELTVITFTDGASTTVELAVSPESLALLAETINARLESLGLDVADLLLGGVSA